MQSTDELYAELKAEIGAVAEPLFEFSEQCLRKHGNFLPHGAVLTHDGKVELVGTYTGQEKTNSVEVLPLLHEGLRSRVQQGQISAVGVAENVTVTHPGQSPTKAVKVLFEHRRGLVVALYLPFEKRLFKGYQFGQTFSAPANAEVNAWPPSAA
jgi:hypothetical protein